MLKGYQKTLLLKVVANPFFLAIPFAILIIGFLPNPASKYKLVFSHQKLSNKPNAFESFYDLNGDGRDEQIIAFNNMVRGEAAIKILDKNDITYDQWNFHGQLNDYPHYFQFADLNQDGLSEVYVLYHRSDSILLAAIQPFPDKKILFEDKLMTRVNQAHGEIDYAISSIEMADFDGDDYKELFFSLIAGFSQQPRGLFIYDFQDETIIQTPTLGAYLTSPLIVDLDSNGMPEIICGSSAIGNIHDSLGIPFSDYSTWFFYFNHALQFKIPPIENSHYPSGTSVIPYTNEAGEKMIAVLQENPSEAKQEIFFYLPDGSEFSKTSFQSSSTNKNNTIMIPCTLKEKPFILVSVQNGVLQFINEKLNRIQMDTKKDMFSFISALDLNNDGKSEYLFFNEVLDLVTLFDNSFKHPVTVSVERSRTYKKPTHIGIRKNSPNNTEVYIKSNEILSFYQYQTDPLYYLKYPLWLFVYVLIAFTFWGIQRLQSLQNKRKLQVEETINNLQMRTIKSQMDPHFMFNVLNGLANNVAIGNTDEAYTQIIRFSKLLRSLMKKSDRIDTNLKDELEFVESYLELEKFRFKEDFEYSIEIGDDVDMTSRIPKMLIQLLVENGIKHGLRNKLGKKCIYIRIINAIAKTQIIIEDNGIGRKAAKKYKPRSGRGLSILQDIIHLNKKLGGKEIQVTYSDLYNEKGESNGTQVQLIF